MNAIFVLEKYKNNKQLDFYWDIGASGGWSLIDRSELRKILGEDIYLYQKILLIWTKETLAKAKLLIEEV